MPVLPPRQVCPLCGDDDDVTALPLGEGTQWSYACSSTRGHDDPYSWTVAVEQHVEGREGITAELGLYDDLPLCVAAGEPWVEHGVVEYRYKLLQPSVYFGELLPRYGHVRQGPKRYTLSALIAKALGQLAREGVLAWQYAAATGFWSYNGQISYWAVPPAPTPDSRTSWQDFAQQQGLDPNDWDLTPPA